MAVPSTFADLSTTPGTNSGLISDSTAVNQIDNHCQSIYALIASIYANSGNGWASPYLPAANPSYTGTLTGGTGVVNLGSGQFYKDASGNVGIGTASPQAQLHLNSSAGGGDVPQMMFSNASTGTTTGDGAFVGLTNTNELSIWNRESNSVRFATANTERMRIDSSGNQINTPSNTPPTLTVNGQMNLTPTSNTNMRISYRGSDGVTRVANITLA